MASADTYFLELYGHCWGHYDSLVQETSPHFDVGGHLLALLVLSYWTSVYRLGLLTIIASYGSRGGNPD